MKNQQNGIELMTRPGLSVPSDAGGGGVSEFAFWAVITLGLRVDVGNMGSGVLETLATNVTKTS